VEIITALVERLLRAPAESARARLAAQTFRLRGTVVGRVCGEAEARPMRPEHRNHCAIAPTVVLEELVSTPQRVRDWRMVPEL